MNLYKDPFDYPVTNIDEFTTRLLAGRLNVLSDVEVLYNDVNEFLKSQERLDIIKADNYYKGLHEILDYKRAYMGENGLMEEVPFLPNNPTVDNQFSIHVDKKTNYSFSKDFTIEGSDKAIELFNYKNKKLIKSIGRECIKCGKAYVYPYYDNGKFQFRILPTDQVRVIKNSDDIIISFYRVYDDSYYNGNNLKSIQRIEYYDDEGVKFFIIEDGELFVDIEKPETSYAIVNGQALTWEKIPLVIFKANENEIGLLQRVKSLQDAINKITTLFINNTEEDVRSTILILENYSGTDTRSFRRDLIKHGVLKVETVDGIKGGVDTLKIEVNVENYRTILDILKKSLIENARSYDAKNDKMGNAPNQMNIKSMYSDIDLDADDMELEFKVAMEELIGFATGFKETELKITFNRDVMMNEESAITMCQNSKDIVSDETILANHPWVDNVDDELDKLKLQKEENMKKQQHMFGLDYENKPLGGEDNAQTE